MLTDNANFTSRYLVVDSRFKYGGKARGKRCAVCVAGKYYRDVALCVKAVIAPGEFL